MIALRCQCCGGEFAGCTRDKYCQHCRVDCDPAFMCFEWAWWALKIVSVVGLVAGAAFLIVEVIQ